MGAEWRAEGSGPTSGRPRRQGAPSRARYLDRSPGGRAEAGGGAWAGPGRGRAELPPRPKECGLWLVPCPHSGWRRNVNRVFAARPERTSSDPSHPRTPGSGCRAGPLCVTPQSPQHPRVEVRALSALRPAGFRTRIRAGVL